MDVGEAKAVTVLVVHVGQPRALLDDHLDGRAWQVRFNGGDLVVRRTAPHHAVLESPREPLGRDRELTLAMGEIGLLAEREVDHALVVRHPVDKLVEHRVGLRVPWVDLQKFDVAALRVPEVLDVVRRIVQADV